MINIREVKLNHGRGLSALYTAYPRKEPRPRKPKDPDGDTVNDLIEEWGHQNDYPQWVMEQIADVTLIKPLLAWKAEALYGGGLAYGIEKVEEGEESFERIIDPIIEDWLEQSHIDQYLMEACTNFYYFYNIFPSLTLSNSGNQVNFLTCKETTDARWGERDKNGYLVKCYISPDWEQHSAMDPKTIKFDVLNPYYHTPERVRESFAGQEVIYPVSFPSPGRSYYQEAPWHSLLTSWLPIARAIPDYKASMLKNQISVRYIIRVPQWWWEERYPKFKEETDQKKKEIMAEEHRKFDEFLASKEKGRSMLTISRDELQQTKYAKWEVDVIDHKIEKGAYIEDSQEADAHIFKNLAVDPSLFGNGAGKGLDGGGSGSNKRVARNNYMIQTKPHQDLILKPLRYVARHNGWVDKYAKQGRLKFYFKNYMIARLDSGSEVEDNTTE